MTSLPALLIAVVFSAAAGVVHIAAAGTHFAQATPLAWAFVTTGWLQLILAAALLTHRGRVARGSVATVNLAAVAAWAVSRSVGLPFAGGVEPIALPDTIAVGLELCASAAVLQPFAALGAIPVRFPTSRRALVVSGVAPLLAVAASSVAIADLSDDGTGHHAPTTGRDGSADAAGATHGRSTPAGPGDRMGPKMHVHGDRRIHVHGATRAHLHRGDLVHLHRSDHPAPPATGAEPDQHRDHHHD